jgi:phosphoribosylamine--glycine ligase
MGAYTPTPLVDDDLLATVQRDILVPTVDALRRDEIDYRGVLYVGLMLTAGGPKVLEFNCRFGDPETQPLVARMRGDLLEAMAKVADPQRPGLETVDLRSESRYACCVVMCSEGYPGPYTKGLPITGLESAEALEDVLVFHAGTKLDGSGQVVTDGGRVLNVVGLGETLVEARDKANAACGMIHFQGAFFRHDIGDRVLTASR